MDYSFLDTINNKVFAVLEQQSFVKQNVENTEKNEIASLYTSEATAYIVVYYTDKKHVVLRTCAMTDEGPDNEWKTLATWMYDPAVDTSKEASSIGNDFAETLGAPVRVKALKTTKKKKKDDEGNNDPLFLSKRMMTLFPELKEEVKAEQEGYSPFRGATFTKAHIVPKVNQALVGGNKKEIEKIAAVLNAQYKNGDIDTRSIITIVILNGIKGEKNDQLIEGFLSEDLVKAWGFAKKYRNKAVKPEKMKTKRPSMAERLAGGN